MPHIESVDWGTNLIVTTLRARRKIVHDNIFRETPLLNEMLARGRVVEEEGGESIMEPIEYGVNPNVAWIGDMGTLSTTMNEFLVCAKYLWKIIAGLVVVSDIQNIKNQGRHQLIKLLTVKEENLRKTLKRDLAVGLFSDGSGAGGLQLTGLGAAVPANPATGVYAGIDRATYTWWRSQIRSGVGAYSANLLPALRELELRCADDGGYDKPNFHVTDATTFGFYLSLFDSKMRLEHTAFPAVKRLVDAGFDCAAYNGKPVVWETNQTTGYWHMLNLDHIKLTVCRGANFALSPLARAFNQLAYSVIMYSMLQLVLTQPRRCGLATGITA